MCSCWERPRRFTQKHTVGLGISDQSVRRILKLEWGDLSVTSLKLKASCGSNRMGLLCSACTSKFCKCAERNVLLWSISEVMWDGQINHQFLAYATSFYVVISMEKVFKHCPQILPELKRLDYWRSESHMCNQAIQSFKKHLQQCVDAGGYHLFEQYFSNMMNIKCYELLILIISSFKYRSKLIFIKKINSFIYFPLFFIASQHCLVHSAAPSTRLDQKLYLSWFLLILINYNHWVITNSKFYLKTNTFFVGQATLWWIWIGVSVTHVWDECSVNVAYLLQSKVDVR